MKEFLKICWAIIFNGVELSIQVTGSLCMLTILFNNGEITTVRVKSWLIAGAIFGVVVPTVISIFQWRKEKNDRTRIL